MLGVPSQVAADSGEPATAESVPDCEVIISQTDPFDGQSDQDWRDPFVFTFSEPDDTAQVLFDRPGTSWWDDSGTVLTFQSDQPLEPSAPHSVAIDFCRSTEPSNAGPSGPTCRIPGHSNLRPGGVAERRRLEDQHGFGAGQTPLQRIAVPLRVSTGAGCAVEFLVG
jgi:hypothetical protein